MAFIAAESFMGLAFIIESCAAADILVLSRVGMPVTSLLTGTSRSGAATGRVAGAVLVAGAFVCAVDFAGGFFSGVALFVAAGLGVGVAGFFMPGML